MRFYDIADTPKLLQILHSTPLLTDTNLELGTQKAWDKKEVTHGGVWWVDGVGACFSSSDFNISTFDFIFYLPNGKQSCHNEIKSRNIEVIKTRKSNESETECNICRSLGVFVIS